MLLVDTSIWVDHLRNGDYALGQQLELGQACIHPLIIGELACGHLRNRSQLLSLWRNLSNVSEAKHEEVLYFMEVHKLMGKGIGWVDMHLLAACSLTQDCLLWTRDKRLLAVAQELELSASLS